MSVPDGFDTSSITSVNPLVYSNGEVGISWVSTAPSGTFYQVYENNNLVYVGQRTYCWIPIPEGLTYYTIGTVGAANQNVSYAASLPPIPRTRALLKWAGGTFEGADLDSFLVYGSPVNGSVSYTTPLATITAYPQSAISDGYGDGGYGDGGFGEAASYYQWESESLKTGTWSFAVVPVDHAGNHGTAQTASIYILAPPGEPSVLTRTSRVTYTYSSVTQRAVLTWGASPG